MDDLLLTSNNSDGMVMVEEKLKQRFKMADMGAVSFVMEIKRDLEVYPGEVRNVGMQTDQRAGVRSRTSNQQPDETLMDEEEKKRYQGIVGGLMYVSQVLRYDIVYAVRQLARSIAKPSKIHMVAAKHTLRHLAGTPDLSITYKSGVFKLEVYSNSN